VRPLRPGDPPRWPWHPRACGFDPGGGTGVG
jgi:hypothetical protein